MGDCKGVSFPGVACETVVDELNQSWAAGDQDHVLEGAAGDEVGESAYIVEVSLGFSG
jgi:hypothetical protein